MLTIVFSQTGMAGITRVMSTCQRKNPRVHLLHIKDPYMSGAIFSTKSQRQTYRILSSTEETEITIYKSSMNHKSILILVACKVLLRIHRN